MVASCQEEVGKMKEVQARCMGEQMRLDEQSLERLKAREEAKKVRIPVWKPHARTIQCGVGLGGLAAMCTMKSISHTSAN